MDQARLADLHAELQALRDQQARSQLILDSAIDYAIITMDARGCITGWNMGARQIFGYAESDALGQPGDMLFTAEDRADKRFAAELRRAGESGRASNERWHVRDDGSRFWASGLMMPLLDRSGKPDGFLNILRDRSERRAEMERRELLMAEMNHRIKNTFATVQAVAAHTRRQAAGLEDFTVAFNHRLLALARSNDVLMHGGWQDVTLADVVEGALAAYGGETDRISIQGAPVLLPADLVVMTSLALHELATNAVKHGALSNTDGRLTVAWAISVSGNDAPRAEIVWREQGGPPVQQPRRRGFGLNLLERGTPPGGAVRLDFQPSGLECRINLPMAAARS